MNAEDDIMDMCAKIRQALAELEEKTLKRNDKVLREVKERCDTGQEEHKAAQVSFEHQLTNIRLDLDQEIEA